MGLRRATAIAAILVLAAASGGAVGDSRESFIRLRLILTSAATIADVRVADARIASYVSRVLDGPPFTRTTQTGQTLRLSMPFSGATAEGAFDVILAEVGEPAAITWSVSSGEAGRAKTLDVYDLSDLQHPRLIDQFTSDAATATFRTDATHFAARVRAAPMGPPLVIANFYPWYALDTWRDPQFLDHPVPRYTVDSRDDMIRVARTARNSGIDVLAVSWESGAGGAVEDDRRMRVMLEAGRSVGIRMCIATETVVANRTNDPDLPVDPQVLLEWIEAIVDRYGSDPAYLRVGTRPVIFVFYASLLTPTEWTTLIARLRNNGRDAIIIGDFFHSTLLDPLDGEYQYINVTLTADQLREIYRTESLRVRTFSLLRPNDRRRIWVASVSPGYDDTMLRDRTTPVRIDRAQGATYDTQWSTAIDTGADWVIITSWNEWWENTEIEPGERYSTRYTDRTRLWASRFKRAKTQ